MYILQVVVASAVRELSFIVAGLFSGHAYDFRVSACNANGQGPPLNSLQPTVARLPFDAPSAPVLPGVVDVGKDYAVLSWQRPERDGGGRLRGYMVEKKEEGTGTVTWTPFCNFGKIMVGVRALQ